MIRRLLPAAALVVALNGCATSPPLADGLSLDAPRAIELDTVPFFPQDEYQCGPAALAMLLGASGVAVEPQALMPQVYLPGRKGSLQAELIGAARRHGRLPYQLATTADEMIAELYAGRPVLVLQNLRATRWPRWHYAVLVGYDADRNTAILRSGKDRRLEMRWQRFASSWHRGGRWAITTLEPDVIPMHATAGRFIEAAAGLEAAGQHAAAAEAYDAALMRWPEQPLGWLGRGNVAYATGDLEAAADAYARAILLAPKDAAARNNLAQVLADARCPEAARTQVERATELAAGSALAAAVEETRAGIAAMPPAAAGCALPGRAWPD